MTRADVRTRARNYLNESVADIFTDDQLNSYYLEELRSLPNKNIYLEEQWTASTVKDQKDYELPTGTIKVESTEKNEGTTTRPDWVPLSGVDNYNGAIYLPYFPQADEEIRIKIKKSFTDVEDDVTALDIPNDKSEVLVWGIVVKAYRQFIGYLRNSESWDTVTKPGDHNISTVQNWLRDAEKHYDNLIRAYRTEPKPRDIDLTS